MAVCVPIGVTTKPYSVAEYRRSAGARKGHKPPPVAFHMKVVTISTFGRTEISESKTGQSQR